MLRVTHTVAIPRNEIELRFSRSSGPGGQHAQKASTRVEAVFDVDASMALSEAQKARVIDRVGPVLRSIAQDERSQLRNRQLAVERLVDELRRGAACRATPSGDSADQGGTAAAPRRQAPADRDEAVATPPGRVVTGSAILGANPCDIRNV